jgi:hypothetical protein
MEKAATSMNYYCLWAHEWWRYCYTFVAELHYCDGLPHWRRLFHILQSLKRATTLRAWFLSNNRRHENWCYHYFRYMGLFVCVLHHLPRVNFSEFCKSPTGKFLYSASSPHQSGPWPINADVAHYQADQAEAQRFSPPSSTRWEQQHETAITMPPALADTQWYKTRPKKNKPRNLVLVLWMWAYYGFLRNIAIQILSSY